MLQLFFPENFQFWHCKFSFSADPVILDLKLQLAQKPALKIQKSPQYKKFLFFPFLFIFMIGWLVFKYKSFRFINLFLFLVLRDKYKQKSNKTLKLPNQILEFNFLFFLLFTLKILFFRLLISRLKIVWT